MGRFALRRLGHHHHRRKGSLQLLPLLPQPGQRLPRRPHLRRRCRFKVVQLHLALLRLGSFSPRQRRQRLPHGQHRHLFAGQHPRVQPHLAQRALKLALLTRPAAHPHRLFVHAPGVAERPVQRVHHRRRLRQLPIHVHLHPFRHPRTGVRHGHMMRPPRLERLHRLDPQRIVHPVARDVEKHLPVPHVQPIALPLRPVAGDAGQHRPLAVHPSRNRPPVVNIELA